MENYKCIYKYIVVILLMSLPLSYVHADGDDYGGFGGFVPQSVRDQVDGIRNGFSHLMDIQRTRMDAVHVEQEVCRALNPGDASNESFCSQVEVEMRLRYANEMNRLMTEKLREREGQCQGLVEQQRRVRQKIRSIARRIPILIHESSELTNRTANYRPEDLEGIPGDTDEEKINNLFESAISRLKAMETEAEELRDTLKYLKTGEGRAPAGDREPNLADIRTLREIQCADAVVAPTDFGSMQSDTLYKAEYRPDSSDTQAVVAAEVTTEVAESSPVLNNERETVKRENKEADSEAADVATSIGGGSNNKTDGALPAIIRVRIALVTLRQNAIGLGGCTGFDCNAPPVTGDPTTPAVVPTPTPRPNPNPNPNPGPNDGLAYGGGTNPPSSTGDSNSEGEKGAMAKTGSGFNMPSLGGFGGGAGANKPSSSGSSGSNYYAKTGIDTHPSYTRNMNGGSMPFNSFNTPNSPSRTPSSTDAGGSSGQRHTFNNEGGGQAGGSYSGSMGGMMAGSNSGGAGNYEGQAQNAGSRLNKKSNKQIYSSRDEKSGGGVGLRRNEQSQRAALDARMEQLKNENKMAGKDAFDPDKYVPRTRAERLALARASGKLGGHSHSREWPNDISRQRDQNIFNLMLKGYQKHLQE